MPLTQQSFQNDPRRRVFVEAKTGFYIGEGRGTAEEGEVLEVPWSTAVTLFHSNKAVQCDGPARKPPIKAAFKPTHAKGAEL